MSLLSTEPDADFEAAFRALLPRAFKVANRLLDEPQAAEDVASEALARMFAHWPKVGRLPHRDAWVLRVTTNLALDQIRRRRYADRYQQRHQPEDDTMAVRIALWAALRALPRRQREVVVLRYIAGLPEADIASALGVSRGSVKKHAGRALTALRSTLGDRTEEVTLHAG